MGVRYLFGQDATVAAIDRGLAYGDGLFETMAIRDGRIRFEDLHAERLRLGADRLRLPLPPPDELAAKLAQAARGIAHGTLKLTVTRGSGPRGYAPPPDPEPTVILAAQASEPGPQGALRVVTLAHRLGENAFLAGIKHLGRLEQVMGQLELQSSGADEGLMLTDTGDVIGGTSRNLFAVIGSRIVTPELSRAGIRGVMREAVLREAENRALVIESARLVRRDLDDADEIFMTNALVGIQSVRQLDRRDLPANRVAGQLRTALGLDDG